MMTELILLVILIIIHIPNTKDVSHETGWPQCVGKVCHITCDGTTKIVKLDTDSLYELCEVCSPGQCKGKFE